MVTNVQSTQLDFQTIRENLKTYFAQSDQFSDYDFEASGLSNILDVLAWNTHFNALTANMAINESFLETAQLRASVLTHAHSLGYFPRSKRSAIANVQLVADLSSYSGVRPATVTLPSGYTLTATVDSQTYTFQTRSSLTAIDDGTGFYSFKDEEGSTTVPIYEGTETIRNFLVPSGLDKKLYVIADPNMDTTSVVIKVYQNQDSTSYEYYTDINRAIRITEDSRYYLLKESPNGYYELQFSDALDIGRSPDPGSRIEVNYLSTAGGDANRASRFTGSNYTVDGQNFNIVCTTLNNSSGGSDPESIESIRFNAPLVYSSQKRVVTPDDYNALIRSNYPNIDDVITWGGQDNDPIDYSSVYICIKYPDDTPEDTKQQTEIAISSDVVGALGISGIEPKFVRPIYTSVALEIRYDFNPNLSGISNTAQNTQILETTSQYFDDNVERFNGSFRASALSSVIDNLSTAILGNHIDLKIGQTIEPVLNQSKAYTVLFPVPLAIPDADDHIITSSRFTYQGQICTIKNQLGTNNLQVVNPSGKVLVTSIGSYDSGSGRVSIVNLNPESIIGNTNTIKIKAITSDQGTIRPLRNYILQFDNDDSFARATIDYGQTRVTL